MQEDPETAPLLLGPLEMLGVQELREANLTIRCRFKTLPLKQFLVAAELRRRIASGFAAARDQAVPHAVAAPLRDFLTPPSSSPEWNL